MEQNTARPLVKESEMVNKFVLVKLWLFLSFPYINTMNTIFLIANGSGDILYTLNSYLNILLSLISCTDEIILKETAQRRLVTIR